jgi:dihydrofolate reductase
MNTPEVIIISALAESNRLIGSCGKVPWHIPHDSQRFQHLTMGHTVVMGRKTWEDDVEKVPLRNRHNIIVSRSLAVTPPQIHGSPAYKLLFVASIPDAIAQSQAETKIFIVGGSQIYAEALAIADTLELTLVEGDYTGDTFFPDYQPLIGTQFERVAQERHPGFRYETYRRMG